MGVAPIPSPPKKKKKNNAREDLGNQPGFISLAAPTKTPPGAHGPIELGGTPQEVLAEGRQPAQAAGNSLQALSSPPLGTGQGPQLPPQPPHLPQQHPQQGGHAGTPLAPH